MTQLIPAHGGKLVNRQLFDTSRLEVLAMISQMKRIVLNKRAISDLELIGTGAFSPLIGFATQADWTSVLETMHLTTGEVWTIPVTLPVKEVVARNLESEDTVALFGEDGRVYGTLTVTEVYKPDKSREAKAVYGTMDLGHPGVKKLFESGDYYVAGPITLLNRVKPVRFEQFYMDPVDTRSVFQTNGWKTIVGFQTRNPIHRAHEYIQKTALEAVDALFLHPLVGETKMDDLSVDIRMRSYQALLDNYYPKNRVFFSVFPGAMRYAGPREAVFHALIRKNFGCTHFIVGRDHAGVGNYYGIYDAQEIFNHFSETELGIRLFMFENSFYCMKCDGMASEKTCPHSGKYRYILSGTKVRSLLQQGKKPSPKFTRPEVAEVLVQRTSAEVHERLNPGKPQECELNKQEPNQLAPFTMSGLCIWFTGLSGAGKTTIANAMARRLKQHRIKTFVLDADEVRAGINSDLGFSDSDRIENVRRLAYVARILCDAGLTVLVTSISPFASGRRLARDLHKPGKFIEVYVHCPIEVCAARDPKGLYQKAVQGNLRNMTGLDSIYEPPVNPEIVLSTHLEGLDVSVQRLSEFIGFS